MHDLFVVCDIVERICLLWQLNNPFDVICQHRCLFPKLLIFPLLTETIRKNHRLGFDAFLSLAGVLLDGTLSALPVTLFSRAPMNQILQLIQVYGDLVITVLFGADFVEIDHGVPCIYSILLLDEFCVELRLR